jgi:hypothetical protein
VGTALIAICTSTAAAGITTPAASSTATHTYARSSTVRACTVVADADDGRSSVS